MAKTIYDKIIDKGKEDAKVILADGLKKLEQLKLEQIEEAKNKQKDELKKQEALNQSKYQAALINAKREAKKSEIKLKQTLLKETVKEAVAKLDNLKQNELFDFVLKLVKEDDLSGKEVIYVNKKDYSKYLATFSSKKEDELVELDKLNNALGKKFELKLSKKPKDLDGGFYIVSEKYDINHSYSALVDNLLAKLEADLNKILFSEVK
ncbi:MAG TPA: V-type ATP synthase subunit E [Bacilli bacterium]|nr:V-type ATP synthase subunit E [Bacilli bacterium]HQM18398.1 V-type ATP synthase subunit E [Bacilli bacterium]